MQLCVTRNVTECKLIFLLLIRFVYTLKEEMRQVLIRVRVNPIQRSECCLSLRAPALDTDILWFTFSAVESRWVLM